MPTKKSTFAGRLRALREAAGISQYELAKRSGLTRQAMSRLELGEREPTWETVRLLSHALGVSCEEFNRGVPMEQTASVAGRGRGRKADKEEGGPGTGAKGKGSDRKAR